MTDSTTGTGIAHALFGTTSYSAAPWMQALWTFACRRPLYAAVCGLLVLAGVAVAATAVHSYRTRALPLVFDTSVTLSATPAPGNAAPSTLQIDFIPDPESLSRLRQHASDNGSEIRIPSSVLDLRHINSSVNHRVSLSPHVAGNWRATTDALVFEPDKHWPANTKYEISIDKSLTRNGAPLKQWQLSFATSPLQLALDNTRLHADPHTPADQRFISTLTFSHPVNAASLQNHLQLRIQDAARTTGYQALDFALSAADEYPDRVFHINSDNIDITSNERYLELTLAAGLTLKQTDSHNRYTSTPARAGITATDTVSIPAAATFFKQERAFVQIARDDKNRPHQALVLELSDRAQLDEIAENLSIHLLPPKDPDNEYEQWHSVAELGPADLLHATRLQFKALPLPNTSSKHFSFLYRAPEHRQILVSLEKGTRSASGFTLSRQRDSIHSTPEFPRELDFLGNGSVMDPSGEKNLGVVSRGIHSLDVRIGSIRTNQVHHLISQSNGDFRHPVFASSLQPEHIARISEQNMSLNTTSPAEAVYSSINLSSPVIGEQPQTGLFHVDVVGLDKNGHEQTRQQRIVLLTDIGFLAKRNNDGTQDVFVQRISTGKPMASANVSVLGANGLVVHQTVTDNRGHARIMNLDNLVRDRAPVALVAHKGSDTAYLPMNVAARVLNTSRFDTGGVYVSAEAERDMQAFLFTDRSIYRPAETVNIGVIVRNAELRAQENFSVGLVITGPRGASVYEQRHRLTEHGFFEAKLTTQPHFATGRYQAVLYLHENDHYTRHLGSVDFSIEEFQPDRLKIVTRLSTLVASARSDVQGQSGLPEGWLGTDELQLQVELHNLYGSPAQHRIVQAGYQLHPRAMSFERYPGFRFSDASQLRSHDNAQVISAIETELPQQYTDDGGIAAFSLDLEHITAGTYALEFNTAGFEENGGRSVHARSRLRFSPREYLVGHAFPGNADFLRKGTAEQLELLCIDRFAKKRRCDNLQLQLTSLEYVSTLVRQDNGTYQYQSVLQRVPVSTQPLSIGNSGYTHSLDTTTPGEYEITLVDSTAQTRFRFRFRVVGNSDTTVSLESDTQLELALDKTQYRAGEWIEMQLSAPYAGSGLITIEDGRTQHFSWFSSSSSHSIQRIQVPPGLRGNAYVQIAFIRSPDATNLFTAPLSYAIQPFGIDPQEHRMRLHVNAPAALLPGDKYTIDYSSDTAGKAVLIAVDEGILQVARHKTPDPLAGFLPKKALQVHTYQMFDLLLPEFKVLRELSASGGGMAQSDIEASSRNLNPFSRKVKQPVAFWSGLLDISPIQRSVSFTVPDHFDGTLRLMVVAAGDAAFASHQQSTTVKGPFVITPNAPTVVAPGDIFTVEVGVSNQHGSTQDEAGLEIIASSSKHLSVLGGHRQHFSLAHGNEKTLAFRFRANEHPGSADLSFTVASSTATINTPVRRVSTTTLSVRPATRYTSRLASGILDANKTHTARLDRTVLAERGHLDVYASTDPAMLVNGLIEYLDVFPHACTEQIVSQATPALAFINHSGFLGTANEKRNKLQQLFNSLRNRQLNNGALALWPGGHAAADIPTLQAMQLLIDARDAGVTVPQQLLENGLDYLRHIGFDVSVMRQNPQIAAHALYLLTRSGMLTTNGLIQLESVLNGQPGIENGNKSGWKQQLTGMFMASSYQLLKRRDSAVKLMQSYLFDTTIKQAHPFDSRLAQDAMAMYLQARHFPAAFRQNADEHIASIIKPVLDGDINTLSSGRALSALSAYSALEKHNDEPVTLAFRTHNARKLQTDKTVHENTNHHDAPVTADEGGDGKKDPWQTVSMTTSPASPEFAHAALPFNSTELRLQGAKTIYYQHVQTGYDAIPPAQPHASGLEIVKTLLDENGQPINHAIRQGSDIIVQIKTRSLDNTTLENIAVVDLLPGGFEIDRGSIRDTASHMTDYTDIREDRVVFYLPVRSSTTTLRYRLRATTAGTFIVPASYANAMYDDKVHAHTTAGKLAVEPAT